MRKLACTAWLLVAATFAVAQGDADRPLTSGSGTTDEKGKLEGMLGVLDAFGAGADANDPNSIENRVKRAAKDIRDAIEKRVVKAPGIKGRGRTEGAVGAKMLRLGAIFCKGLLADHCTCEYLSSLETLVHEGQHFPQPSPAKTLAEAKDGTEELNLKLEVSAAELPAYKAELDFKRELRAALAQFSVNRAKIDNPDVKNKPAITDKVPAWAHFWQDCPNAAAFDTMVGCLDKGITGLDGLVKYIELRYVDKATGTGDKTKAGKVTKSLGGIANPTDTQIAEFINKCDVVGLIFQRPFQLGPSDVETLSVNYGNAPPFFEVDGEPLEVGVPFPQDLLTVEDVDGRTWLVIAGNEMEDGPGILRAVRLTKTPTTEWSVAEAVTLTVNPPGIGMITALARREDGRMYVLDVENAVIRRLEDQDADLIPDAVGPTSAAMPPADDMRPFTELDASGNDLVVTLRAIAPVLGNTPQIHFHDANLDGQYETFQVTNPSRFPSRAPTVLGNPVAGSLTLFVSGTHGHQFVVVSSQGQQPLGQGRFIAFPDVDTLVQLSRPLQAGEVLVVNDLANNQTSEQRTVVPRAPAIYSLSTDRIRPKAEEDLTIHGSGFEQVATVTIGEKEVTILSRTAETLVLRTGKMKSRERWTIEFTTQDGGTVMNERFIYPEVLR